MLDSKVGGELLFTTSELSLLERKWRYRGEGNANLVIALPQQRQILRLHKVECRSQPLRDFNEDLKEERHREADKVAECADQERVWREVLFCRRVMVPLVGSCYLHPSTVAKLDSTEVHTINALLRIHRPVHRHHKEVAGGYVTLHPDYALLPTHLADPDQTVDTFCVEVKPKQGWVPPHSRNLPKCTYCTKQFLKLKNKTVTAKSSYCPLDLFSGQPLRMKEALQALLATPQNNLKLFKNGILVYGDDVGNFHTLLEVLQDWFGSTHKPLDKLSLLNIFCSVVIEALTRDLSEGTLVPLTATASINRKFSEGNGIQSDCVSKDVKNLINAVAPLLKPSCDQNWQELPVNCVLDRILNLQMLETSYSDSEMPTSPRSRKDYGYVGAVICDSGAFKSPLHRYLLAATAKDCSVLLAFQPVTIERTQQLPRKHIIQQADNGQLYVFNVGVSDLDPKPVSCIEKHRQRDREMILACFEMIALKREVLMQQAPSLDL